MNGAYMQDKDGRYIPAIPEPYWSRGWKTLFRMRPACYQCRWIFENREQYDEHYVTHHLPEETAHDH